MANLVSYSPEWHSEVYDAYDLTLARWLTALRVLDRESRRPTGKPIPLVFATPKRAHAMFRQQFGLPEIGPIPYPFLSMSRIGSELDMRRSFYNQMKYRRVAFQNGQPERAYSMPWPKPFTYQYSLDLWSNQRYDIDIQRRLYHALFDNHGDTWISVDHGEPLGVKIVNARMDSESDASDLEPGDREVEYRYNFSFSVQGWEANPLEPSFPVHRFLFQLYQGGPDDPEVLERFDPAAKGNPETGQTLLGDGPFETPYDGPDFRFKPPSFPV